MKNIFITTLIFVTCLGCANKLALVSADVGTMENEKGGVTAQIAWIKNKPQNVDFEISLLSNYGEDILIKENSFVLEYQGEKSAPRSVSGSPILRPKVKYQKILIFPLSETKHRQGEVTLTIEPIQTEKSMKALKPLRFVLPLPK